MRKRKESEQLEGPALAAYLLQKPFYRLVLARAIDKFSKDNKPPVSMQSEVQLSEVKQQS